MSERVALILPASSPQGRAKLDALAGRSGWQVVAADAEQAVLLELAPQVTLALTFEPASASSAQLVSDVLRDRFGRLDLLVLAHGDEALPDDDAGLQLALEQQLVGPAKLLRLLLPLVEESGGVVQVLTGHGASRAAGQQGVVGWIQERSQVRVQGSEVGSQDEEPAQGRRARVKAGVRQLLGVGRGRA